LTSAAARGNNPNDFMLEEMKQQVCAANLKLVAEGLVITDLGQRQRH
jgi:hypothetical protein